MGKTSNPMVAAAPTPARDGRVRRSQRSGQAILDAMLELVGEGVLAPTAQQVATRANVGIRTVFRRFSDMESLYAEMDQRLSANLIPMVRDGQPSGTIAVRGRQLVARRAELFERIAPYKRSGNLKRWRSPFLHDRHALLVRGLRRDLLHWLPEARTAPDAVVAALEMTVSFEAWDRLRSDQGLGRAAAEAAVAEAVAGLLGRLGKSTRR